MRGLFLLALALLVGAGVACGDDDDTDATPTPGIVSLPRHLESITPEQNAAISNDDLPIGETGTETGICAGFNFREGETMGDDPTSLVAMLLDGEPVTDSLSWVVTDDFPTSLGTACYAPPVALEEGSHEVTVAYSDASERQFQFTWHFEITE
jgi:hypothetical protein